MTPFFADDWLTVYAGDCREVLPTLAADSVDCIVTSPPYWGLRDYGTATWSGGDAECDHVVDSRPPVIGSSSTLGLPSDGGPRRIAEGNNTHLAYTKQAAAVCPRCGATRQDAQLGLEATPELYVANLVAVFRELRRVLKGSGTCWLNLGDSYVSNGWWPDAPSARNSSISRSEKRRESGGRGITKAPGLKPKDLVGIPWRVAFALQADGWYLRSDIIWAKPNPMPESVTDRPTKAHEYLFLLTKSARYFYDADAVREPAQEYTPTAFRYPEGHGANQPGNTPLRGGRLGDGNGGRNLRSVWTIATRPYPGAHFAVFPPELPERCIKAGSSERGVCPDCGAPWERVVERELLNTEGWGQARKDHHAEVQGSDAISRNGQGRAGDSQVTTLGWQPYCRHETLKSQPAVILDPFAGSGTVGMVANRLSRRAILIDLNPEYVTQQMRRNAQTPLGLPA